MSVTLAAHKVWFVDTSILDNILPVPGRNQNQELAVKQLGQKLSAKDALILPIAAVIEAGNHIAQVANGSERRGAAVKFSQLLELVAKNQAPWTLHSFGWDGAFLELLVNGPTPNYSLVDHAMAKLGGGDLCILAEREVYRKRTGLSNVHIWSLDTGLMAHD